MSASSILKLLKAHADPAIVESQKRYGIHNTRSLGIAIPVLRKIAKEAGKDQKTALALWKSGIHEARHVATMIADPAELSDNLMDEWLKDFNSWDIVDGACSNYFRYSPNAYEKAIEWTEREKEFEKRAAFSMMCYLAVHDKKAPDSKFEQFFPYIYKHSGDERNFVKKAVNWAIRQIGKRNEKLCRKAIKLAKDIRKKGDKASLWIASGALRELESYLEKGKIRK